MCCLLELRWRGQDDGIEGRRCKLWWSVKGDGVGGVGVMVMDEMSEKVMEVRMVSDGVMAIVLVFEEDVLRLICAYFAQNGRCFEK